MAVVATVGGLFLRDLRQGIEKRGGFSFVVPSTPAEAV